MKVITLHICPVCKRRYDTPKEAITCRNKHEIKTITWVNCEACGQGWNVGYFGLERATQAAKECEQKHRENGDYEQVREARIFFENSFRW